jgi:antitoxin Phd
MRERKRYSIAEARDRLPAIVHDVEANGPVELTRRGKPVAVVLSMQEYERLRPPKEDFWDAYQRLNKEYDFASLGFTDEDFAGLRDQSPGREVPW